MSAEIYIVEEDGSWPDVKAVIKRAVCAALIGADYKKETEISIVLANDKFIQALNHQYRDKDKPTNVLSFPQDDELLENLGDVIFALKTIENEAKEQDKKFEDHLTHLAVHGTLHLLGYDHETDEEAEEMESLEIQILKGLNISNPYA